MTEEDLDRRLEALQMRIVLGDESALEQVLVLYLSYIRKWAAGPYLDEKSMWKLGRARQFVAGLEGNSKFERELRQVLAE